MLKCYGHMLSFLFHLVVPFAYATGVLSLSFLFHLVVPIAYATGVLVTRLLLGSYVRNKKVCKLFETFPKVGGGVSEGTTTQIGHDS